MVRVVSVMLAAFGRDWQFAIVATAASVNPHAMAVRTTLLVIRRQRDSSNTACTARSLQIPRSLRRYLQPPKGRRATLDSRTREVELETLVGMWRVAVLQRDS
jgi:hypothetical protein